MKSKYGNIQVINEFLRTSLYAEVEIEAADILDMGNTEIELLPSLPSNQYYQGLLVLEYTHVTTPYILPVGEHFNVWYFGGRYQFIDRLITSSNNMVAQISSNSAFFHGDVTNSSDSIESVTIDSNLPGRNITLSTYGSSNPTAGDGTILAKIYYNIKTFGTEL